VKIVQAGTGNAFEVHDQASDSTIFSINHQGYTSIGVSGSVGNQLHVDGDIGFANSTIYASGGSGKFRALDGTAAAPYYTFSNDTDVGMYRVGTNQLGFTTAGALALTIGSSGEITIPGQMTSRANVVAVSSNTTLTTAQSGSYVYWTAGTCTLPASCTAGTQFTIFNNTGSSATVALGTSNSVVSNWASNAAVADNDATSYVAVSSTNWVQVGA
jgi:hypothetical protein